MSQSSDSEEKKIDEEPKDDKILPEEELSEDKYQINQNKESNLLADKIIQLLQEKLLGLIDKFNIDLIKKYDTENIFDKEMLDQLEEEIENYKQSYIEQQFKIIKEIISKYNLIENLKNLSEECVFAEELKSYDINIDIFSFIGPLSEKIKEINKSDKNKDINNKEMSNDIERALFKLLEIYYYNSKTSSLEESIKALDIQIEDLKNKNKII